MHRRTLLAGAGATLVLAVAGCAERDSSGEPGDNNATQNGDGENNSDRVADVEFQTRGDARDVDVAVSDNPNVEVDEESREISVEGRYGIGDRCHDEVLASPVYHEEHDSLTITLSREHDGRDECELEEQEVPYRVFVRLDGPLPGIVEVSEDGNGARGGATRILLQD